MDHTSQDGQTPRDRSRIDPDDEQSCRYWSKEFGVTPEQLREAVHQVGPSVDSVVAYLQSPATGRTT